VLLPVLVIAARQTRWTLLALSTLPRINPFVFCADKTFFERNLVSREAIFSTQAVEPLDFNAIEAGFSCNLVSAQAWEALFTWLSLLGFAGAATTRRP